MAHPSHPQVKVKVGDRIPDDYYFGVMNKGEDLPHKTTSADVFHGKKVVLFGIPGIYIYIKSVRIWDF